ncbi:MAG: GNAT family N-acetyltransferase [Halioglobus sp.]|nr:GNAT family N-acetyltransferase [Halioglobus sp.]
MDIDWHTLAFAELGSDELYALLRLRQQVFVVEQQSIYLDLDGKDQQAVHMLCRQGDELAAYQRCLPPGVSYEQSSIGRIVVHPQSRGAGLGRELVRRGIAYNRRAWPGNGICISAQAHLQDFYASMGFVARGNIYQEDGIPHRQMRLDA